MNKFVFGLTLMAFSLFASAQDAPSNDKDHQYVTDQLRLSLYQEPSAQSKVLKLLQSGDMLIIDEIRGPYALVTAPDGVEGWVKRGFLVTNPTSNILLREEREKNASLFDEIEKLTNSKAVIDTYEKDMDEMVSKMEALQAEDQRNNETIAALNQEVEDKQQQLDRKHENNQLAAMVLWDVLLNYWKIIVPVLLAMLLLCFLISKAIVEAHIKAKFHGIKIW